MTEPSPDTTCKSCRHAFMKDLGLGHGYSATICRKSGRSTLFERLQDDGCGMDGKWHEVKL